MKEPIDHGGRPVELDEDALDAALDVIGRTGARRTEIGYLDDDVPVGEPNWYAYAQFHGTRIAAEHHVGPVEAVEALARKLIAGGRCTHCGKTITLGGDDAGLCRWTRQGKKWVRGCQATHHERAHPVTDEELRKMGVPDD